MFVLFSHHVEGRRSLRVVHISSVHSASDPRIRRKQLATIRRRGHEAWFVTGDLSAVANDGVVIVRVPPGNKRRILRILVTSPLVILRAFAIRADIYHFHDPELLPWALLLKLKGVPVIYDVHEDNVASVARKRYLPSSLRRTLATLVGTVEKLLSGWFLCVIAERYYSGRFPNAVKVLNYPDSSLDGLVPAFSSSSNRMLYTGNVTVDRGALTMARVIADAKDLELTIIGSCSPTLADEILRVAGKRSDAIEIVGVGRFVPFDEIVAAYRRGGWIAGLALFPESEHYREKELTKFFEYMAAGIPIVASDFPAWRNLIDTSGLGVCVDSSCPNAVIGVIDWLRSHHAEAAAMSARGPELVRRSFSWESQGSNLLALYDAAVGSKCS